VDIQRYQNLKKRVDDSRQEASRAEGALSQLKKDLKDQFGVGSLKDADKLLKKMEADLEKAEGVFDKALAEFEKEWEKCHG